MQSAPAVAVLSVPDYTLCAGAGVAFIAYIGVLILNLSVTNNTFRHNLLLYSLNKVNLIRLFSPKEP